MVDQEFWKETADMFSKLIEKPKMQEKFLRKPPPRYVYDMIINTMEKTGFPKGLYTDDELNVKYFEESPQNKVEFFQKTIDVTKIVLNDKFEIKTTNILKGDEPDKTNYFLQAFYRAATSGKDATKYIQRYLEHKKKKADEKKKDNKEEESKPEKPIINQEQKEKAKVKEQKESLSKQPEPQKEKEKSSSNVDQKQQIVTTEAKKTVTTQRPMSSYKKPEKIASEIKEVDDEKNTNNKAPQGLIKDSKKTESKEKNNNDEDLSAPKQTGSKIKISQKLGFFKDIQDGESGKTTTLNITDIESIKNYVQEISKNSNPIGKLLDFLGDDIESMNKELQTWIKESKTYKDRLDEEIKKTEEVILPLNNELIELEDSIRDENMRIRSIKSRLIKNEQIIQNLINNVISIKSDK